MLNGDKQGIFSQLYIKSRGETVKAKWFLLSAIEIMKLR